MPSNAVNQTSESKNKRETCFPKDVHNSVEEYDPLKRCAPHHPTVCMCVTCKLRFFQLHWMPFAMPSITHILDIRNQTHSATTDRNKSQNLITKHKHSKYIITLIKSEVMAQHKPLPRSVLPHGE